MKMRSMLCAAAMVATPASAGESQIIDLGGGTTIEVKDGAVRVHASGGRNVSQRTNSRTDAAGNTVTTVVVERDGERFTREITISADGKVSISDPQAPGKPPAKSDSPPPVGGWMGVHTVSASEALRAQLDLPEGQGIVVEFLAPNGPAAKAGIAVNDILLEFDGTPISGVEAFREGLRKCKPGQKASLRHMRKGKVLTADVTLGERPPDAPPGDAVAAEAERLLKELQVKTGAQRRTIVVDENGRTHVIEGNGGVGDPFELLLNDPMVPDEIKDHLRKTRRVFEKAQPKTPGKAKPN